MTSTYSSLNIHFIFSTKHRAPLLTGHMRERLWAFMGGIARENNLKARCIGGVADHVHLLISMPTSASPAQAMQQIKGGSSSWLHKTFPELRGFSWQEGYGAFSVSISHVPDTIAYIENQEAHHRKTTFQDEYVAFLKKHGVDCEEKYLWD